MHSFNSHCSLNTLLLCGVLIGCLALSARSAPISTAVVCVNTTWEDILLFFATNYVAHAGTAPTTAGRKWPYTFRWSILPLFLPFASLAKAIALFTRHILRSKPCSVHSAIARGAVVTVARSKEKWEPRNKPELIYVALPEGFYDVEQIDPLRVTASFDFDTVNIFDTSVEYADITIDYFNVHGSMSLPAGYIWVVPRDDQFEDLVSSTLKDIDKTDLCQSHSWIKMAISVAQLLFSSITIYRTRGQQIERFGYAAFGLSVFPYTLMSLVNLICMAVVGDYPYIYVINSAVLQEAAGRGGHFDGVIGVLNGSNANAPTSNGASERGSLEVEHKMDDNSGGKYVCAHLWMESEVSVGQSSSGKVLVVEVGETIKKFKFEPGAPGTRHYKFGVSSITNQDSMIQPSATPDEGAVERHFGVLAMIAVSLLVMFLPYVFIFVMTRFHNGHSTASERAWMTAWLCARQNMESTAHFVAFFSVLAIASIGGFVEVAMMYKAFGSCSLSP